jgi:hypothetical protein
LVLIARTEQIRRDKDDHDDDDQSDHNDANVGEHSTGGVPVDNVSLESQRDALGPDTTQTQRCGGRNHKQVEKRTQYEKDVGRLSQDAIEQGGQFRRYGKGKNRGNRSDKTIIS